MREAFRLVGQPFSRATSANLDKGVARSGVKGPLIWGSSSLRLISITWSYLQPSSGTRFSLKASASLAAPGLSVATRYSYMRLLKGKMEVVAPISAPMLQMVAMPVAERDSVPGPWYSTMAPVPPFTDRMPATLRMISLCEVHLDNLPVSFTPITLGHFSSQGKPAMTSTASAPPTPMAATPKPPALGVWESVPIMRKPGMA
mmetsp:Transcript_11978/g.32745  ORF Transcript_11978/g.32745 Transcript_11978/m.32745 type:complete len:202 (-) Transcript_11978:759-1364(-)